MPSSALKNHTKSASTSDRSCRLSKAKMCNIQAVRGELTNQGWVVKIKKWLSKTRSECLKKKRMRFLTTLKRVLMFLEVLSAPLKMALLILIVTLITHTTII